MKRDLELVRLILLELEEYERLFRVEHFEASGYKSNTVLHHVWLLREAGYLQAVDATNMGDPLPVANPTHLTWEGHEFLSAARDETVWKKANAEVAAKAGSATLEILLAVLRRVIGDQLGLQL